MLLGSCQNLDHRIADQGSLDQRNALLIERIWQVDSKRDQNSLSFILGSIRPLIELHFGDGPNPNPIFSHGNTDGNAWCVHEFDRDKPLLGTDMEATAEHDPQADQSN